LVAGLYLALVILSCELIAQLTPRWLGGIPLPYISDTAALGVGYWVFSVGGSLGCVLLSLQHTHISSCFVTKFLPHQHKAFKIYRVAGVVQTVANACLALLMCFSTYAFPEIHAYAAYAFFSLSFLAQFLYTSAISKLSQNAHPEFLPSLRIKKAFLAVFTVSFVIYLPVGLGVVCTWNRLPMSSSYCEENTAQCADYPLSNSESDPACLAPPCTQFWDYSGCPSINLMRSVTQLLCVICLGGYQASFVVDNNVINFVEKEESYRVHHAPKGGGAGYQGMA
jgi:hypothetical protein